MKQFFLDLFNKYVKQTDDLSAKLTQPFDLGREVDIKDIKTTVRRKINLVEFIEDEKKKDLAIRKALNIKSK